MVKSKVLNRADRSAGVSGEEVENALRSSVKGPGQAISVADIDPQPVDESPYSRFILFSRFIAWACRADAGLICPI